MEPKVGQIVAGRYRLDRLLARGGMGSVWVATHLALESAIAIKFIAARVVDVQEDDSGAPGDPTVVIRARFEREARAAARIRSTNVVQVLDYGIDLDAPYMVMELLDGEDLGARIKRKRRLSVQEVSRILVPVARALQRAHDEGLIHRDLKPENIFLAKEGDEEVPKILDFGVVKAIRTSKTTEATYAGQLIGTPDYMSPQQVIGEIDHRSDLWSLGVIFYHAVTGQTPFNGDNMFEIMTSICKGRYPAPREIVPDLPPAVDRFVARALAVDPETRFPTATAMARALGNLTSGSFRAVRKKSSGVLWLVAAGIIAAGGAAVLRSRTVIAPAVGDGSAVDASVAASADASVESAPASATVTTSPGASASPTSSASRGPRPAAPRPPAPAKEPRTGASSGSAGELGY